MYSTVGKTANHTVSSALSGPHIPATFLSGSFEGNAEVPPSNERLYECCQQLQLVARFRWNPITEPFFSLLSHPAAPSAGFLFIRVGSNMNATPFACSRIAAID